MSNENFAAAARHGHHPTLIAPGGSDRTDRRDGGEVVWVRAPHLPVDRNYRMFWDAAPVWRAITAAAPDLVEAIIPWRGGWLAGHWPGMAARTFVFHQDFVAGYPHTFLGGVMTRPAIDRLFLSPIGAICAVSARVRCDRHRRSAAGAAAEGIRRASAPCRAVRRIARCFQSRAPQ